MSQYATSFLLLNLGSEMLFVVSQRLQAQNISQDRATHVLDKITSSLINQKLIVELLKIGEVYNHQTIKQIINDIAQSSIMRLDPVSMDRLWDLIIMVFKWQITLSQDIIAVTSRHLYEIETFSTNPETQLQLQRIQNVVDNFSKILTKDEKIDLTQHILTWLHSFNVKVSLLLRLGFQKQDGSFNLKEIDARYKSLLENVGENIYAATKNLNLAKVQEPKINTRKSDKYELNTMISQILGEDVQNKNIKENAQCFKLSMCDFYEEISDEQPKRNIYSKIDVKSSTSALQNIFEITTSGDDTTSNLHEELLNIIDENC